MFSLTSTDLFVVLTMLTLTSIIAVIYGYAKYFNLPVARQFHDTSFQLAHMFMFSVTAVAFVIILARSPTLQETPLEGKEALQEVVKVVEAVENQDAYSSRSLFSLMSPTDLFNEPAKLEHPSDEQKQNLVKQVAEEKVHGSRWFKLAFNVVALVVALVLLVKFRVC